ncbi:hypothetical protein DFS33DRAFT_1346458 [Desarmillaria ectypa]|nr:hypothetical protein DFS33DRAFT_1346458 [Desarmillaria ectypa]
MFLVGKFLAFSFTIYLTNTGLLLYVSPAYQTHKNAVFYFGFSLDVGMLARFVLTAPYRYDRVDVSDTSVTSML